MTHNKKSRRKSADPVWRRMHVLSRVERIKASLLAGVGDLPPAYGEKEIDKFIADAFAASVPG